MIKEIKDYLIGVHKRLFYKMDFTCSMCFVSGMLFGSFLETRTMLFLITVSMVIANHPLPELLGGVTPQSILRGVIIRIGKTFKKFAIENKNSLDLEESKVGNKELIQENNPEPIKYPSMQLTYTPIPNIISNFMQSKTQIPTLRTISKESYTK